MTSTPVRFGIALTNQHPLDSDLTDATRRELELAIAARDLGFDAVAVTQHFLTGGAVHGIDQVAMLGRLIDVSADMRLSVSINLLALHNPVAVAEQFASIDVMSGGRLTLGVGLGYRPEEYAAFGLESEIVSRDSKPTSLRSSNSGRATHPTSTSRGAESTAHRSPCGHSNDRGRPS